MNRTIEEIIKFGKQACADHGFGHIDIYQTTEENVRDGWDRFIVSPAFMPSDSVYQYIGFVRKDGSSEIKYAIHR